MQDSSGKFGFMLDQNDKVILNQFRPTLIPDLKNIVTIRAGADFALALDKSGGVFGWGAGQQSQLGRRLLDRHRFQSLRPTRVPLPRKKFTQIFAGANHAWAIEKSGVTYAWGSNNFAQTGIVSHAGEDNSIVTAPTKVPSLSNMKMLAGGNHHSIGVGPNDECLVWGRMDEAQLGIDKKTLPVDDESKVLKNSRDQPAILLQPTALPNIQAQYVAAGSEHCLAVTTAGKVYSWGFSANYQTGLGTADTVELATVIDNTAMRDRKITWADGGGQFSVFAGPA
jgi:regulator of chromosome condensation